MMLLSCSLIYAASREEGGETTRRGDLTMPAQYQVITATSRQGLAIQLVDQGVDYKPIFFTQSEGIIASGETIKNVHYTVILELR